MSAAADAVPAPGAMVRWLRFNTVGVAGMAVQLVTLALLNHVWRRHYLVTSGIAVEAAVLHNFVAHMHYTWRDRRLSPLAAWWRFQISNGAVSLIGNTVMMRLLVSRAHLHVLAANGIAIVGCGLLNFWLGDYWAFAARTVPAARAATTAGAAR